MHGETKMRQPEPTEEEMNLAMEVEAHNRREWERAADLILATQYLKTELGIDVPGVESVDADGRMTYDHGALDRHVSTMPAQETRRLLLESRAAPREMSGAMMDVELAALRRLSALSVEDFAKALQETDDVGEVMERREAVREEMGEIESLGRHWQQDQSNVIWHAAHERELEACDARIAELSPSPAP